MYGRRPKVYKRSCAIHGFAYWPPEGWVVSSTPIFRGHLRQCNRQRPARYSAPIQGEEIFKDSLEAVESEHKVPVQDDDGEEGLENYPREITEADGK